LNHKTINQTSQQQSRLRKAIREKKSCQKEKKKPRKQETPFPRIKTNYEIRQDYVQGLKQVALDESRKIYDVLEETIGEYLERLLESKV
jgi:hypothetical protein